MAGSLIDLSGSGAKAGTLAIVSSQAALLDGVLRGDDGGSFTLDTGSIPSFAPLADKLAASGFNGDLSVRLRAGDLTIDGTTRASSFALAADAGSIVVTGTIDVSGAKGGTIALSARQDLTVAAGARLSANAGDASERSGSIELSSTDGTMDPGAIYLGALEIRGADNIQAGGEIKGVPKPARVGRKPRPRDQGQGGRRRCQGRGPIRRARAALRHHRRGPRLRWRR